VPVELWSPARWPALGVVEPVAALGAGPGRGRARLTLKVRAEQAAWGGYRKIKELRNIGHC